MEESTEPKTFKTDPKVLEKNRRYREANREKVREWGRKWSKENPKRDSEHWKAYYERNKDTLIAKRVAQVKEQRNKIKLEIYSLLGNKCLSCGFADNRAFHVDHINGGGTKERKQMNRLAYLKNILEQIQLRAECFQLLCANCHQIKHYDECQNQQGKPRKDKEVSL